MTTFHAMVSQVCNHLQIPEDVAIDHDDGSRTVRGLDLRERVGRLLADIQAGRVVRVAEPGARWDGEVTVIVPASYVMEPE